MPYTFRVVFSGLCLYHLPTEFQSNGGKQAAAKQGDPSGAVLLVNATKPRTSIDGKTFLHHHAPTLTFDPAELADYSVDTDTFETDFRLIPKKIDGSPQTHVYQDTLAVLNLENKELRFELHPQEEPRPFHVDRHTSSDPALPNGSVTRRDLRWVPSLKQVDRRIRDLKRRCFADVASNPLVASRVVLDKGTLQCGRLGEGKPSHAEAEELSPQLWDFYPNNYPGRTKEYDSNGNENMPRPNSGLQFVHVRQALAETVVLELENLEYPIQIRYDNGHKFLAFPKSQTTQEVTLHVANLPTNPNLSDTDVVTSFRWFYELVDWQSGLPSDLPAPRPAGFGLRGQAGSSGCGSSTYP